MQLLVERGPDSPAAYTGAIRFPPSSWLVRANYAETTRDDRFLSVYKGIPFQGV